MYTRAWYVKLSRQQREEEERHRKHLEAERLAHQQRLQAEETARKNAAIQQGVMNFSNGLSNALPLIFR